MAARRRRPGGRSAQVGEAVYAATLQELSERGFSSTSLESIAARAGIHKSTLYRRWGTLERLVTDAVASLVDQQVAVPDTGSLENDLLAFAEAIATTLRGALGKLTVASYFSAALEVPALAKAKRAFFARRHRQASAMVTRAIARGEVPAGTDPAALVGGVAAPLYYRRLVTGLPLDRAFVQQAVTAGLLAARGGAFRKPARTT